MLPHDELGAGPAVVLLHAGVADRSMWSEHLGPLADAGYRAVALELPGFGEAPLSPTPWAEVLAAMDRLGIDPAAVVGNSFGGAVALRMAVVAPDKVSSLVLVSAPAPGIDPSPELRRHGSTKRPRSSAATSMPPSMSWCEPGRFRRSGRAARTGGGDATTDVRAAD